jgi:signal transduction histidine kinase
MRGDVDFVPESGEMAALIRAKDWAKTPLGPPSTWPASLRTLLRLVLTSRYAMWMGWGPDLIFFYNDAYARETLGAKHPWALGRAAREVWAEVWTQLDIRARRVLESGEATWDEGLLLFLERSGYPEETYHTFSYSPAPGDSPGEVAGLFCVVVEETERVIGERRIGLLQEFAALLGQTHSMQEVLGAVERCLTDHARDIPFSITYVFDEDEKVARRVSQTGFGRFAGTHPAAPEQVALGGGAPWPFHDVLAGTASIVALSGDHPWPTGAWEKAPSHALVVPIATQGHARPTGVFVAGLNPHRLIDKSLRSFVELFVGQLAAALSNARAYAEERRRADALAEVDRAKTAFFSNVSHEFRTPLTLMLGPTEDALGSPDRALRGDDLDTVHRNELRLLKLVNALLDFARTESSRIQASYEPTDLAALTVDLASSFRSAIERAGLAFEVDCPPLDAPVYVDRDMWEKIVLNLLSNALKFTFDGRIRVALRPRGDAVVLTVADDGVGVSDAELPRLFERFHRIEGTRARTHEGSGIGLALVHELVRLHGGTIDVTSQLGAGTTFTIAVPRGTAHLPQDRVGVRPTEATPTKPVTTAFVEEAMRWTKGADPPASRAGDAPQAKARIVVADDNADMRDYITRLLRERWLVEAVSDGKAALEAIEKSAPALILSDVMMPGLDGFGLLRAVRADPRLRAIPFILLSARAGEEASVEGLNAGADDYIVKPFAARDLVVRVASRLAAAEARHDAESARDRAEELAARLFSTSQRLRAAQQVAGIGIFDWNLVGDALFWSPELYKLMGLEPDAFAPDADKWTDRLYDETDRETAWGTYRAAVAALRPNYEYEVRFRQGESGSRWVRLSGEIIYDAAGKPLRTLGAVVDVQILKEAAAARARALADAERTSRAKDEFLATMSHELRTPLNAMLGWARILKANRVDEKRLEHGLAVIERNAETQARLVSDLLDVSRIISGKLRLTVRKVSVAAVIMAAMDVVRQAAEAKGVHLTTDLDPDLGSIAGDPDRLQQIVWNLLSNAVKFTPARGSVLLSAVREDSAVRISVQDSGAGIAPENLPLIFERFRQVDSSTTRVHGGLGLGLAIVRHLTEAHGGVVTAASEGLGKGSTFTVVLPLRAVFLEGSDEDVAGPAPEAAPAAELAGPRRLEGISVLVVDDDQDSLELLRVLLEEAGAKVTAVTSARSALEGAERRAFDLVVSDIGMPEMDGYAFIRSLRERRAAVPAIALTAYARAEDAERARRAGYQEHVAKPVDGATLVALLERLLARESRHN